NNPYFNDLFAASHYRFSPLAVEDFFLKNRHISTLKEHAAIIGAPKSGLQNARAQMKRCAQDARRPRNQAKQRNIYKIPIYSGLTLDEAPQLPQTCCASFINPVKVCRGCATKSQYHISQAILKKEGFLHDQ
ncbi:MAG: hypothetical protein VB067_06375, partial [Christensenellaceae bacterium]|nr:hypothetical protein [Christensenellaceae bacterium]